MCLAGINKLLEYIYADSRILCQQHMALMSPLCLCVPPPCWQNVCTVSIEAQKHPSQNYHWNMFRFIASLVHTSPGAFSQKKEVNFLHQKKIYVLLWLSLLSPSTSSSHQGCSHSLSAKWQTLRKAPPCPNIAIKNRNSLIFSF